MPKIKIRNAGDPRMRALLRELVAIPPELYRTASLVADYHELRNEGPYMGGVFTGALLAFASASGQSSLLLTVVLCEAEKASAE